VRVGGSLVSKDETDTWFDLIMPLPEKQKEVGIITSSLTYRAVAYLRGGGGGGKSSIANREARGKSLSVAVVILVPINHQF
jgi:hypothetical protein